MNLKRIALALGLMLAPLTALAAPLHESGFAPISADAQAARLGRGVNVLGFDPLWNGLSKRQFSERHFAKIRAAGFDTVRVNLFAFRHMDAANRLDPNWLKSLDWVVDTALANHLNVILEEQDMAWCAAHVEACRPKLKAFWAQVAPRYRNAPNSVLFELLNEPNGALEPVWNDRAAELIALIRQSNPERNIVVDPNGWASLHRLAELKLPEADRHLIVTIHYYDPRPFTHQGATWAEPQVRNLSGVPWGSAADRKRLHEDFAEAKAWSIAHHRPILLGEFGAYDKGPMDSRVRYLGAVARQAEAEGWPWIVWEFDHDFVVYDMAHDHWVEPILHALIPAHAAAAGS